jgi:hypothetical protein
VPSEAIAMMSSGDELPERGTVLQRVSVCGGAARHHLHPGSFLWDGMRQKAARDSC